MKSLRTIGDIILKNCKLEFKFQEKLTKKLDKYNGDFNQDILNEVVLWKVNRYAQFDEEILNLLNTISKTSRKLDKGLTRELLELLLNTKGVKIAMASTILRFKNPYIYQIIDQRVYRIIYGVDMPKYSNTEKTIDLYFTYLSKLRDVCKKYEIDYKESDRVLYALDKEINKGIKIKY